jgi:hypothetical protein
VSADEAVISEKDKKHPVLADLPRCFRYEPLVPPVRSFGR